MAPLPQHDPVGRGQPGRGPGTADPAAPGSRRAARASTASGLALRVVAAAALGVSGLIHLHLAGGYRLIGQQLTVGDLFLGQAVVAAVAALALLVRPVRLSWALAAVVGFGSLAALVLTVYVAVPAIGPFPRIYEPIWFPEKVAAAVAAALAAAAATAGLLRQRGARTAHRAVRADSG
jgi:hypothetical protein